MWTLANSGAQATNTCLSLPDLLGAFLNHCFPWEPEVGLLEPWWPMTLMLMRIPLKRSWHLLPGGKGLRNTHREGEAYPYSH